MLRFCLLNNGAPFNHVAYYMNLLWPGGVGIKHFDDSLMRKQHSFFCTQFIVVALQCCAKADKKTHPEGHWKHRIWTMNAATSNPNSLYRLLHSCIPKGGVFADTAIGVSISLEDRGKADESV